MPSSPLKKLNKYNTNKNSNNIIAKNKNDKRKIIKDSSRNSVSIKSTIKRNN